MKKTVSIILMIAMVLSMACGLSACGKKLTPTEATAQFLEGLKAEDPAKMGEVYENGEDDLLSGLFGDLEEEGLIDESGEEAEEADDADDSDDADDDADNEVEELDDNFKQLILDFDYELDNEQIDGDTATVDVTITTYPLGDAMAEYLEGIISEAFVLAFQYQDEDKYNEELDKVNEKLMAEMQDKLKEKTFVETGTLELKLVDDKWVVAELAENSGFMDLITGGLMGVLTEVDGADEQVED